MLIARHLLICTLFFATCAAAAEEGTRLPSDPRSWGMELPGFPTASDQCAGGELQALLKVAPDLTPHAPEEYEATYEVSLRSLRGLRSSDRIYPFYHRWDFRDGEFAAVGGYIVARGNCIIHAQTTFHDN